MVVGRVLDPSRRHPQPLDRYDRRPEVHPHGATVAVDDGAPAFVTYHEEFLSEAPDEAGGEAGRAERTEVLVVAGRHPAAG
jgi:hypothetical protein